MNPLAYRDIVSICHIDPFLYVFRYGPFFFSLPARIPSSSPPVLKSFFAWEAAATLFARPWPFTTLLHPSLSYSPEKNLHCFCPHFPSKASPPLPEHSRRLPHSSLFISSFPPPCLKPFTFFTNSKRPNTTDVEEEFITGPRFEPFISFPYAAPLPPVSASRSVPLFLDIHLLHLEPTSSFPRILLSRVAFCSSTKFGESRIETFPYSPAPNFLCREVRLPLLFITHLPICFFLLSGQDLRPRSYPRSSLVKILDGFSRAEGFLHCFARDFFSFSSLPRSFLPYFVQFSSSSL